MKRATTIVLSSLSLIAALTIGVSALTSQTDFAKATEPTWWENGCVLPSGYTAIADIVDSGTASTSYTTRGTITSIENNSLFIQSRNRGIMVYSPSTLLSGAEVGNVVDVTGTYTVYNNLPELTSPTVTLYQSNNPYPVVPLSVSSSEYSSVCTTANIGRLITLSGITATARSTNAITFSYGSTTVSGYIASTTTANRTIVQNAIDSYITNATSLDFSGILGIASSSYQIRVPYTTSLTEHQDSSVPVTSISVSPSSASIATGTSQQFTASVLPANASDKTVTWSANGGNISSDGLFSANSSGTYTITATANDGSGISGSTTITVTGAIVTPGVIDNPVQDGDVLGPMYIPEVTDTMSVNYLEMTSSQYGDSILIDYGDFEILVDGGQPADEANVEAALANYVTDNQLEILVVTHPHGDHYGGLLNYSNFVTNSGVTSIKYIVDFGCSYTTTQYTNYVSFRTSFVDGGSTYYPIYQMIHNGTSNYPNVFQIADGVTMTFLDTNSYLDVGTTTSDPNECSVSFVLSAGNYRYFLCGDADTNAEAGIVSNYSSTTLWSKDTINILKANHHGSTTSNTASFLALVKPDYCMVSASIVTANRTNTGIATLQHPYGAAITRIASYTSNIYWNAINGTIHLTNNAAFTGLSLSFDGRTVDYYDKSGSIVSAASEKSVTYPNSSFYSQINALQ